MLLQGDLRSLVSTLNFNSQLGAIIRYLDFWYYKGRLQKKMTNFLLCAISPAMIIFILETVPQNCGSTPVSTVKVGGKNIPTPFYGWNCPKSKISTLSLKTPGY